MFTPPGGLEQYLSAKLKSSLFCKTGSFFCHFSRFFMKNPSGTALAHSRSEFSMGERK